jgi:uncharacterized protein YbjT (DUF2867 family)
MYVVFGASGNTGKVVADTLLSQNKPVRVVVRDEAKGAAWKAKGAEVAVARVEDAAATANALRGATGAYLLLPPDYASNDNIGDKKKQIGTLVDAITASGIKHIVLLSSVGAQHADGTGPIKSLFEAERRFNAIAGLAVTSLRAPYFMENFASSLGPVQSDGVLYAMFEKKIPMIATKDIGLAAAKLLVEGATKSDVVELHGPALYNPTDAAALLAKILSRDVNVFLVPAAGRVPALTGAGLTPDLAALFAEMNAGVDAGLVAFEGGTREAKGATTLDQVLRALLGK